MKYGHKGKNCRHKEGANVPKCHYCNKPGHVNKDCRKRTREEKAKNNKNKDNKNECNYFKMNHHEEKDCYKKKKSEKESANNVT